VDARRHLYHARISKHLSLQQVATRTALSPSVLRNIDEGRFELLPSGVYARSYVRTFAAEVGLDPEATLAQVEHLLPGAPDPLPALNQMKSGRFDGFDFGVLEALRHAFSWLKTTWKRVEPAPLAVWNKAGSWPEAVWNRVEQWPEAVTNGVDPWPEAVINRVDPWPEAVLNRVDPGHETVSNRVHPWPEAVLNRVEPWLVNRCSAALIDALVLLAVDAILVLLISLSSGVGIEALLQNSGWALGAFCTIPIALYFVLFEGIAGTTVGRRVCSLIDPSPDHPLTLPDILRRAVFH